MTVPSQIDRLMYSLIPRVISLVGPSDICNLWRSWWPSGFLATKGFVADWCRYEEFQNYIPLIQAGRYNLIVTPRIAFANDKLYAEWRDQTHDLRWVYECDDDLWSPGYVDRQVVVWNGRPGGHSREQYERERVQRVWLAQQADGVTVTTDTLARVAKSITSGEVRIVPNSINVAAFMQVLRESKRVIPPLTIGWSGTLRNDDDLKVMATAWKAIAARYPNVKFIMHGFDSPSVYGAVPADRLTVLPVNSPLHQPAALMNFDIACCAVSDDPWNLNKTPVKWMEATLAGSACVVSKALYGKYVEDGITGLVADSAEQWEYALSKLIEDEPGRRRVQHAAELTVIAKHSLDNNWEEWVMAWSAMLDSRRTIRQGQANATYS